MALGLIGDWVLRSTFSIFAFLGHIYGGASAKQVNLFCSRLLCIIGLTANIAWSRQSSSRGVLGFALDFRYICLLFYQASMPGRNPQWSRIVGCRRDSPSGRLFLSGQGSAGLPEKERKQI